MSLSLVLPGLAAITLGVASGQLRWNMRPAITLWLATIVAATSGLTALTMLFFTASGLLASTGPVSALVNWCPIIPLHHQVSLAIGLPAVLLSIRAVLKIRSVLRTRRWAIAGTKGQRLSILATAEPIAYAAPGSPGCVVVSDGLLEALDPRERQVVFAHERAHLRQRHAGFLLIGSLSMAVLPFLRPLIDQIQLATEQCADEEAVRVVGGDRQLVAEAVARAALATSAYHGLVGSFGGASIPARVEALIGSPIQPAILRRTVALAAVAATIGLTSGMIQLHHFVQALDHICT